MKTFLSISFWLFLLNFLQAQTIMGKIQNSKGEKILLANVIIKDSVNAEDINEFVLARNGEYKIVLENDYEKLVIEITANGYISESIELGNLKKNETYIRNFTLIEEAEQIEELVVKAKKDPFSINEDTTKFDVQAYRDGTERKIQDLIKKLPGMQVNEKTGEIKYKGKSIETIKLDGDDLFGSNYSIGSRNINVDAVEQIQAIENYSDNPLLKGIESSDKVILNLKLKKSLDVSGDIDFGNGIAANKGFVRDVGGTLLGVTKKYKSFGNLSYNNIGVNNTPFDYFSSFNYNPEQIKERNFFAQKLIPESGFTSALDDRRVNINNTVFGSYNHTFKLGKRVNVKNNFYYISDKITSIQSNQDIIRIDGQSFETSDQNTLSKKPLQLRGDMEIKINSSKKSLTEYRLRLRQENIFTPNEILQNNTNRFASELCTNDFYFKQNFLFTQKISDRKALQISFDQSLNDISQTYRFSPSLTDSLLFKSDEQISQSQKNYLELKTTLLGSQPRAKYTFVVGANSSSSPIKTFFSNTSDSIISPISDFLNDFVYQKNAIFNQGTYRFRLKKWQFAPIYSLSFLSQKLQTEQNINTKNNFIFEPSLGISRKLSDITVFRASYNFAQTPFSEEKLYTNPIFLSQRNQSRNRAELNFEKRNSFATSLYINDLDSFFQLNVGTSYTQTQGSYFSDINIASTQTQITYFFLPQNIDNFSAFLMTEKFYYKALILLKYNANFTLQNYKNIVNGSDLRDNQMQSFSNSFEIKTAFKIPLNFQNTSTYSRMLSQNEVSGSFLNQSWSNRLSLVLKQKQNVGVIAIDYFVPNAQRPSENYLFVDFSYALQFKNRPFSLDIIAKNLLNKNSFEQVQTSDFSLTVYRSNLIGRYLMIRASCNF